MHDSEQPPIFQSIFGENWHSLPPVFHKHYANRPYTHDRVTVKGRMNVELSLLAKLLAPLMRLSGALVPQGGVDIPVTVHFRSESDSAAFCFDRIFHFPNRKPFHFRSRMVPSGQNEIIEYMPIGIGWKAAFSQEGNRVIMRHRGYACRFFPLPITWLIGRGDAWEEAIDDNTFHMRMTIRHWLFGVVYAYSGTFTVKEIACA